MVRPVPSLSLLMKSLTLSPWLTPTILSTLASRPGLLTGLQPPEISWNISRTQQESVPCSSPHPTQSVESCHKQEDQVYRCWRQDLHETCCCGHSVHLGWYLVLKIVPVLMSSSLTCRISFRSKLSWAVSSLSLSSTRCSNVCHPWLLLLCYLSTWEPPPDLVSVIIVCYCWLSWCNPVDSWDPPWQHPG